MQCTKYYTKYTVLVGVKLFFRSFLLFRCLEKELNWYHKNEWMPNKAGTRNNKSPRQPRFVNEAENRNDDWWFWKRRRTEDARKIY